jgi:hypothetical protein
MKDLLESLQKWLKRNRMAGEVPRIPTDNTSRERQCMVCTKRQRKKKCLFCEGSHWADSCPIAKIREKKGKHSLLHVSCVSTVDQQVIQLVSAEVEGVIHVKGDVTQVYATEKETRTLFLMHIRMIKSRCQLLSQ